MLPFFEKVNDLGTSIIDNTVYYKGKFLKTSDPIQKTHLKSLSDTQSSNHNEHYHFRHPILKS